MAASGLRLDLHNHTSFSSDGLMSPAELLAAAGRNNVDCIAVTDHNTLEGALWALELSQADPSLPRVIPGIEVSTADGDVIGLYVREPIPSGLSVAETMDLIREQDGLVYLPHPYGVARRGTISSRVARPCRPPGRPGGGAERSVAHATFGEELRAPGAHPW